MYYIHTYRAYVGLCTKIATYQLHRISISHDLLRDKGVSNSDFYAYGQLVDDYSSKLNLTWELIFGLLHEKK